MIAPVKPFRPTLALWLSAEGRLGEALKERTCACGRSCFPERVFRVDDRPDLFPDQVWVCETCASDLMRREEADYEVALREYENAQGRFDEEQLNEFRAKRDSALTRSDWVELPSNIRRLGPELAAQWDQYREDVRAWFSNIRDEGEIKPFPSAPE